MKKKNSRFYSLMKWTLVSLLALILVLAATAFVLTKFYENEIKGLFISELNKRLQTEINAGDIHISFFRQFPFATLEFVDLTAKDAVLKGTKDTLLKASSLQLHFNILDLYHKKYVIKRIDLKKATVKLKVYRDLSDNFHCWKTSEGPSSDNFSFALDKVVFTAVRFQYSNAVTRQDYQLFLQQVRGKGKFSDERFDLKLSGKLFVNLIRSGTQEYLHEKKARLNIGLSIDQQKGKYTITQGDLNIGNQDLTVGGSITYAGTEQALDLHIRTADADLESLISDLPYNYADTLKEYKLKGKLQLKIDITGKFGGKYLPLVESSFVLDNGSMSYSKGNIALEELSLSGIYRNNASELSSRHELTLQHFKAKLNKGRLEGKLEIKGFRPAGISLILTADLALSDILQFIPSEKIPKAAGNFKLSMSYKGEVQSLETISPEDFLNGRFNSELDLKGVSWELKDKPYTFNAFTGAMTFNNNDVLVNMLEGTINGNTFRLSGYFRNMVPFLLSEGENLQLKANLASAELNLTALITENKKGGDAGFNLGFPDRWGGEVTLRLGKLKFGEFHGEKVNCALHYSNKKLIINQLSMFAASGTISGEGIIDGSRGNYFDVTADAMLKQVDITRLFYQFGNFGQDYILDENLKGILSSEVQCAFRMSPGLIIEPSSIVASMEMSVEQGELINYKPISGLGRFIRVEDLSRVKFSTLKNTVYIKDKVVTIPFMDVVSDAINFSMSGTHTFNHEINYRFQVLLSEILSKKAKRAKKENEEFGIEQADNVGRTTLFILLTGTVDNPVFRYDSKSVKGKIIANFLNEKQNLRESLKKEFTRSKLEQDSAVEREEHIREQQESGKFVVDFEGSLTDSLSLKKKTSKKESRAEKKRDEKAKFRLEWEEDVPVK